MNENEELKRLKELRDAAQRLQDTFLKQVNYEASALNAEGINALNEFGLALRNANKEPA